MQSLMKKGYILSSVTDGKLTDIRPELNVNLPESELLPLLVAWHGKFTEAEIFRAISEEFGGQKRSSVMIALNRLSRDADTSAPKKAEPMTLAWIFRREALSEALSRRNFVRRVYRKNKLFALEEIRVRYPDYTFAQLNDDLVIRSKTVKRKKHKPVVDLRRCQLFKLAQRLIYLDTESKEYHHTCCRIVLLQQAHDKRLPIPLLVTLNGEPKIYEFKWTTRENAVKSFVDLANTKGITHAILNERHEQLYTSINSY